MRWATLFLLLFNMSVCFADDLRPASLTLQVVDDTHFDVLWKIPTLGDKALDIDLVIDDSAQNATPKRVVVTNDAYIESWRMQREGGLSNLKLSVLGLSSAKSQAIVRLVDVSGSAVTHVVTSKDPSYVTPQEINANNGLSGYVSMGIKHILTSLDHLLFVLCLVFVARGGRKLLVTITGFTVSHSITLILSTLDFIRVPNPPVEAAIALSIVFMAMEIARNNKQNLSLRNPVVVSSSFGLLHGLGFATVLGNIGLPMTEKVPALLLFNVGVEIGQLIFISALFLFYFLLKSVFLNMSMERLRLGVAYFSGSMSMVWLITRLSAF